MRPLERRSSQCRLPHRQRPLSLHLARTLVKCVKLDAKKNPPLRRVGGPDKAGLRAAITSFFPGREVPNSVFLLTATCTTACHRATGVLCLCNSHCVVCPAPSQRERRKKHRLANLQSSQTRSLALIAPAGPFLRRRLTDDPLLG